VCTNFPVRSIQNLETTQETENNRQWYLEQTTQTEITPLFPTHQLRRRSEARNASERVTFFCFVDLDVTDFDSLHCHSWLILVCPEHPHDDEKEICIDAHELSSWRRPRGIEPKIEHIGRTSGNFAEYLLYQNEMKCVFSTEG
jgi:hypothetical protein